MRHLLIVAALTAASVHPGDAPAPAPAPAPTPPPLKEGHSIHGEAFNEGPRQKAYLMAGMPKIDFPVTTKNADAQAFFSQGVGQLHGFWYFEAERSFRQVALLDPECAMAYWGMAMANTNNEKRAKAFIAKAVEKKKSVSAKEQAWIDALNDFYAAKDDGAERRKKLIRALETIVQDHPADNEAKAFLVYYVWKFADKLPISSHQAVDTLLEQIFAANPVHPAQHYRIHLWDNEKPARAVHAAGNCGQTGPGIAHLWHMPGHTYSKLHRYADVAWHQEASARTDYAQMMRDQLLPDQIFNYAHNNEWLLQTLTKLGRFHHAIDLAKNMVDLPRHPKYNTPEKDGNSSSYGRLRLRDMLLQYEQWDELQSLLNSPYLEALESDVEQARHARALGVVYFRKRQESKLAKQIDALNELVNEKRKTRDDAADAAEAKAQAEKKADEEVSRAAGLALRSHGSQLKMMERALWELKAYAALLDKDKMAARAYLHRLKDGNEIRKEQLALLFYDTGDAERAEQLARKAAEAKGEVTPLAVLVDILDRRGKEKEAIEKFNELREVAAYADLDMPVFKRLEKFIKAQKLSGDWRAAAKIPADIGARPELNSLGKYLWEPTPAPEFALSGSTGGNVALKDFHGKAVLVVFNLGLRCSHCVEQLHAFAPLADRFKAAGINIVAISSETAEQTRPVLDANSQRFGFLAALLNDPQMNVFKQYRAFDDFENKPLHGTFLIDGSGLLRWHDVSYEPFMDARFILDEAQRLLKQKPARLSDKGF